MERRIGPARVAIVGGGLTGLVAAHRIATRRSRPLALTVLEAQGRPGGAIRTELRDGFTLEGGADSFITNKRWGIELCGDLGLSDQLIETDPRYRRSFVVRQGKLVPVPDGFILMAPNRLLPILTTPLLSLKGKARLFLDLVLPRLADDDADESLASFVRRRFGREVLERLVQPLVGGIYTADPAELSLKATLPQFAELERRYGSVIRGSMRQARTRRAASDESGARYGMFVTLGSGMGGLANALVRALPHGTVKPHSPVRRVLQSEPGGPWTVELLDGPALEADAVVLATEAHASARLVDSFDPELAQALRAVPYASSAIVNIAYRRDQVAHPLDGFGAVVPFLERRSLLAVSFTSVKFPRRAPAGTVLMRAFFGGATQPELFEREDDELIALARQELLELLGARGEPLLAEVARHPRGMPQYTLGHLDRVELLSRRAARHAGLALAGNYFNGVGIPDCIRSGQVAADHVLKALAARENSAAA